MYYIKLHCNYNTLHSKKEDFKMAEGTKPRSIRLDDEIFQKLKEITEQAGGSQQDAIQRMINAYYMQEQRAALPDCKSNLDEFESYITSLLSMYTQALQAQQDTRQAVMQEFNATLKSKDDLIIALQDRLNKAKTDLQAAKTTEKEAIDENKKLQDVIAGLQSKLEDKIHLNQVLTDTCDNLKIKVEQLQADAEEVNVLRKQVKNLEAEQDNAIRGYAAMQEQIKQVQQQAKFNMDKALLDADRAHQEQLQQTINEYQSKVFTLIQQMQVQVADTAFHGSPVPDQEAPAPKAKK